MKTKETWSNIKEKVHKRRPSPAPRKQMAHESDDELDERDQRAEEERNLLEFKVELLIDMLVVRELDRRRELE
eukprot:CAMPEP_0118938576 /NCGR_PEP_ID=MMETSP1169-20130426/26403_1 /TAXON_ID=36882 /ORGANISM="Pyramimonas obovata, Strain CCMP722" /LENGTH=72 /DNA_ID=CAMNT_0006882551 /DNA_START=148 /DNA_END=366 /DNA_ORIENTATION=-